MGGISHKSSLDRLIISKEPNLYWEKVEEKLKKSIKPDDSHIVEMLKFGIEFYKPFGKFDRALISDSVYHNLAPLDAITSPLFLFIKYFVYSSILTKLAESYIKG